MASIIELFIYGNDVFGSDESFRDWLNSSNIHLTGKRPVEILDGVTGINFIRHLLDKIEHGAPV